MKIILTVDEAGLGKKGDLLDVSDGHARNYLIPKGVALRATKGLEQRVEEMRKVRELKEVQDLKTAEEIAERLKSASITIATQTSPEGKLYGSVSLTDILAAIKEQYKVTLDKSSVKLANKEVKEVGHFQVKVSPHKDIKFNINLDVVAAE